MRRSGEGGVSLHPACLASLPLITSFLLWKPFFRFAFFPAAKKRALTCFSDEAKLRTFTQLSSRDVSLFLYAPLGHVFCSPQCGMTTCARQRPSSHSIVIPENLFPGTMGSRCYQPGRGELLAPPSPRVYRFFPLTPLSPLGILHKPSDIPSDSSSPN